jgi:hypothetical protein
MEDCSGYRLAWKSIGVMDWHWQYYSERVLELTETEEGGTEFRCWETFGGIVSLMLKATVGGLLCERFGDLARDLKGVFESQRDSRSESRYREKSGEEDIRRGSQSRGKIKGREEGSGRSGNEERRMSF